MKITFLYCEGLHDMAFLAKVIGLLQLSGNPIDKVKDLPPAIKQLVDTAISNVDPQSLRIDKPLPVFFPNKVFPLKEDEYLCIYSMGGKEQLDGAIDNIKKSSMLFGKKMTKLTGVKAVRHAFILDADYTTHTNGKVNNNGGLENTLNVLSTRVQEHFPNFKGFTSHAEWLPTEESGDIGNFIFTDDTNEEGTLEDLLESFIKPEALIAPAEKLVGSIIEFDTNTEAKEKDKTKLQKIKFSSITQAFHPGSSLAVGLMYDNFINTEVLSQHQLTVDFNEFLSN